MRVGFQTILFLFAAAFVPRVSMTGPAFSFSVASIQGETISLCSTAGTAWFETSFQCAGCSFDVDPRGVVGGESERPAISLGLDRTADELELTCHAGACTVIARLSGHRIETYRLRDGEGVRVPSVARIEVAVLDESSI